MIVPEEISKRTLPLGYVFASFLRKKKGCAGVGGMSPQNQKLDAALFRGRSENFGTLLRTEDSANLSFVELRAPHRGSFVIDEGARDRLREGMVLARKTNWFCFPSPENRIKFDFHGDGASF